MKVSSATKRPAVFLDRDGTLIEDRGFLGDVKDVVFFPATVAALQKLSGTFDLFIVTNQRGVARTMTPALLPVTCAAEYRQPQDMVSLPTCTYV